MSFGRATKYVIRSVVENMSVCRASKTCHLAGSRIMSWGPASKYVIWSGIEISHLVGHLNMSFGRSRNTSIASIYIIWLHVIWSCDEICHPVAQRSKCVIWSGVEICHLVGRRKCHLVGRRNISFGNLSFGRASKFVIWSGVNICQLVGRRIMSFGRVRYIVGLRNISFGQALKHVIWSGIKIYHFFIFHLVER